MTDPHYKALLIGNGVFDADPNTLKALQGPANDVRLLGEALTHPQFGIFSTANITSVLDATRDQVLEAAEIFFSAARPEDHLIFYYSGHGCTDINNNLFLCARNTRTDRLVSSGVSDQALNLMAQGSRARKLIFMLDCCHSGAFKGGGSSLMLSQGNGRCLITSSASNQSSKDANLPSGASPFTHFLAQALTSGEVDIDGDGIVLTSEVFQYVRPRVFEATTQVVQWTMDKTFGEAALACAPPRKAPVLDAVVNSPGPTAPLQPPPGRPLLEVSTELIQPPDVQPGEKLPAERVYVSNGGDGKLDWTVQTDETWISIERATDNFVVQLDTAQPGTHRGNIYVRDSGRGGSRTVRVLLRVAQPEVPKLVVSPDRIDFGSVARGTAKKADVRISNAGPGFLKWEIDSVPAQLVVNRNDGGFTVEVAPDFLGTLTATLRVKSNGGDVALRVVASVAPPLPANATPPRTPAVAINPAAQAFAGWWMNDSGALHIKLEAGALVYTDHNLVGIQVGAGTIQVQGGNALIQGTNNFSGPYSGQLAVQGNMLSGSLMVMGQFAPVMFMRNQPWFAAFAN